MKTINLDALLVVLSVIIFVLTLIGCASTNSMVANKSGVQLWGENCIRCHNTPAPDTFSDAQWDVAVTHMRVRALLTQTESEKIVEFLKSAN